MKDRRSCKAAELWQGISSSVILVAGTMVHQNREPQGAICIAGVSKLAETDTVGSSEDQMMDWTSEGHLVYWYNPKSL